MMGEAWADVGLSVASGPTTRDVGGNKGCTSVSTTRAPDYKPPMCPDLRFHSLKCKMWKIVCGKCLFYASWAEMATPLCHWLPFECVWLHWKRDSELPDGVGIGCWICPRVGRNSDSTWATSYGKCFKTSAVKQHALTGVHRRVVYVSSRIWALVRWNLTPHQ